ncbi:diguanylate cyclase [Cupriavidus sp. WKF15]|uniref:diguanylate cyclase domain-containing protein n=1 Tax=Cupriavidus sp. WKF15 TaxID=3032282 RepID=UPI0023E271E2|nr:diguanylate cyclase [Cupriavidus sp. WKF15]WER49910.1 diguanylate cyclase [Cupriavidus sp. WKF15]
MVRWSLKSRVVASTVVVVLLLAVLLLLIARQYIFANLKDSLQAQQDAQVRLVAEQLNDKFETRVVILRRLAEHLAPLLARGPEELKRVTEQAAPIPELFDWVFLAWPDGKRAFDTRPIDQNPDISNRKYFRDILGGASVVISEPVITKVTGAPGIGIAVPVRSADGRVLAVLVGSFDLGRENFLRALSRSRIGMTGTYCLISSGQSPRYVVHADPEKILKPAASVGESCGTDRANFMWESAWPTRPIVARHRLETAGWELVATLPAREAFSPITRARVKILTAAGAALAIAGLLMWRVARRLLAPLGNLERAVEQSAMDLSVRAALPTSRADEIGALARTFSSVMGQLSDRTSALLEARRVAEEREARIHAVANHIPDLVAYLDVDKRYVFVNQAYEQRFRMPASKIIGLTPSHLWGEDVYAKAIRPHLNLALSGDLVTFDAEYHYENKPVYLEVTYQPAWNGTADTVVGVHVFARDITVERQKMRELEQMTLSDYLTGLLNRKGFARRLASAMEQAEGGAKAMALLLVDLDNFKLVNDTYGHAVGDKLLIVLATRLRSCVRRHDAIARIGGDEFAVVLEDISTSQALERVAEAIVLATAEPCILDGHRITCSTSVGGVLHKPDEDSTRNELFLKADTALYAAKHAGKARFVVFGKSQAVSSDFDGRADSH